MPHTLDQILPSLEALGLWSYWIIGLASLLEAFFATGVVLPGTLVVEAGGILVQQGVLDFFDLAWFVAIGSILGGEAGYWAGVLARRGLRTRWRPEKSPSYQKAEKLFRKHGGMALVAGRFLGPVSGLMPFAAAVAGMERRKFLLWNIISSFPYALAHVSVGYFLGDVITRLGPLATRVAAFGIGVALLVAVLWWLVLRTERMLPFVLSIGRSIISAIGENPDVRAWAGRHPRLARLIASRFDTSRFGGLTGTLLGALLIYLLGVWIATVFDFLMADPIVQADMRLANLVHAFWTPGLLRFFAHVTALGDWRVVGLLFVFAAALALLHGRRDLAIGLTVALLGDLVSVGLLKRIFERPRPELSYFVETSGSFPSGHAAISVAFFGMLFYIAWRLGRLSPVVAGLMASTLAFFIGLSRLYLIAHYLSDVLNGWLVGALWLVIGISVAEWWRESRTHYPPARNPKPLSLGMVAVMLAGTAWFVVTYDKARNIPAAMPTTETVSDVAALFASAGMPTNTESIAGTPLEPINIVVLARDRDSFDTAMTMAGWLKAEKPGLMSLTRAAWAAWTNQEDGAAPVTPYFWAGQPNDQGFQRPTTDRTLRKRHHVRFWRTRFVLPDGTRIFVGAASFDDGLDWGVLHHIGPNIDTERDTLVDDLKKAGNAVQEGLIRLSPPRLGQSVAGDPWFTDGKAVIVRIR